MGLIFDIHTAKLYESWRHSPQGKAMEQSAERFILSLLKPQPGERVLDIGCGDGNHLLFFSQLGLDISGIDASPYMISRAKERLGSRCSLKKGIAEDLPYDDNEFDFAVLINTLEFLDDPLQALREAGRVTNRKVFVGVMNSLSFHFLSAKLQGFLHKSFFNRAKFYSVWELKSYVQMAYGRVPVAWSCGQTLPPFVRKIGGFKADLWNLKLCPFGSFLGLCATILYGMRTDKIPLKVRMKGAGESVARGLTMGNLKRGGIGQRDERGLPI